MSINPNDPAAQAAEAAREAIEKRYDQANSFINKMKADQSQISKWQQELEAYESIARDLGFKSNIFSTEINSCKDHLAYYENDLKNQEAGLAALFPGMQALCDTLNSLLDCINHVINGGGAGIDNVFTDIKQVHDMIMKLFDAMQHELKVQEDETKLNSAIGDNLSSQEFEQLVQEMVGEQATVAGDLGQLQTSVQNLVNQLKTDSRNAQIDKHRFNGAEKFFDWKGCNSEIARDDEIIQNAQLMCEGLQSVLEALAPAQAAVMPQMTQILAIIQMIVRDIRKILSDPKLTLKEKQGQILALVMFLLTFFQIVKQTVDGQKAKNNQDMSQGAIQASKDNIAEVEKNQKIKEEEEHNAAIMKNVMLVTEITLGAVMMVAAPGYGTAFVIAMITAFEVCQTEGVFNLTQMLGDKIGSQIAADVIVGVTEALLTLGVGAGMDILLREGVQALVAAVKTAIQDAVQVIRELVEKAMQSAVKTMEAAGRVAADAAERSAQFAANVSEKLSKEVGKIATQQFMKQSFGELIILSFKSLASKMGFEIENTFGKALQETIEKSVQEATQVFLKDSEVLMQQVAQGMEHSEEVLDNLVSRAAREGVGSQVGKSGERIAQESKFWDGTDWGNLKGTTIGGRAAWSLVFGLASNNFLTDSFKKMGADDDTFQEILGVIQALIQMIALMLGSGQGAGATLDGVISKIPRLANLISLAPQGAQVGASLATANAQNAEGDAVSALTLEGSIADLLHGFLEQLQKDANLLRDIMIKDQQQDAESTASMAGHMHDADGIEAQVLLAGIG